MIKLTIRGAAILAASFGSLLQAQVFETLHQFDGANGRFPEQAMTVGPDGNLYGVTTAGGLGASLNSPTGGGVVFRYSLAEGFTKLADLNHTTTGSEPRGRLLNIGDGYLYGVNYRGGTGNGGTVYRLDPQTGGITVVFHVPAIMGTPYHPIYLASGEPNVLHVLCEDNSGIRRVPLDGGAASVSVLLAGTPRPQSFIRATNGFLYGGTLTGGTAGKGSLFRTNADGTNFVTLHSCELQTGTQPRGAMVQAPNGNLYGLMSHAGKPSEDGVLYRLSPDGAYTPIHFFTDFRYQYADLLLATDGMLYGTGWAVGPNGNGNGGVWRIKTNGSGYRPLHTFITGTGASYPTGRTPVGGLVQASDGHIYGTTKEGAGSGAAGTIFRIRTNLPPPPVNRAPIAVQDIGVSNGEPVTISVLANDFDPDGDSLTVTVKAPPNHGTAEVQPDGSILYTPNGESYAGEDQFTYEINDMRGGKSVTGVQITGTAPPALFQPGAYNGLVDLNDDLDGSNPLPRGQYQLSVQASGSFTGMLIAQGKRVALRGKFVDGRATARVTMPDRKAADVFFTFQAGNPSTILAVFFGTENWTGVAGPVRTSGETRNLAYTIQIPANPAIVNGPLGHGYGTMTIKPTGAVLVVGKLGDGSNLKWSTSLIELPGETRAIPAYSVPLKQGVISGSLYASNDTGIDFPGTLAWSRPAAKKSTLPYPLGFDGKVDAQASRFVPPAGTEPVLDIETAAVRIEGRGVGPISGPFTIDGKKITIQPELRSFTINRATGIFSGVMKNGRKTISFKGAINQQLITGAGQFTLGGETGSVVFLF